MRFRHRRFDLVPFAGLVVGAFACLFAIRFVAWSADQDARPRPIAAAPMLPAHAAAVPHSILPVPAAAGPNAAGRLWLAAQDSGLPDRASEIRIALVIGNKDYRQNGWRLVNPLNDAKLMRDRLAALGFDVDFVPNATGDDLDAAYLRFNARLAAAGRNAISVVYYAGHGIQENGVNYIVPIDAVIEESAHIALRAKSIDPLIGYMAEARSAVNIVFLDACRTNPLASDARQARVGLAPIPLTPNFLISYAAQPGRPAFDGAAAVNSPYTAALARSLAQTPGKPVYELMQDVRTAVYEATGKNQVPEWRDGLLRAPRWAFDAAAPATAAPAMSEPGDSVAQSNIAEYLKTQDFSAGRLIDLLDVVSAAYGFDAIRMLADRGEVRAIVLVGTAFLGTRYKAADYFEARRHFSKACDLGDLRGCASLGGLLALGLGGEPDAAGAFALSQRACEGAIAVGCSSLGEHYYYGKGVAQDFALAADYFQKACEGRYADACSGLGFLYVEGKGVARDFAAAVKYFRRSCEGGFHPGCTRLGYMYANGLGGPPDDVEAARLFRYACEGGDAEGCNNLGYSYAFGRGAPQDDSAAVRRYRQACEGLYPLGCTNLALMYEAGRGVPANDAEAVRLFDRACAGGDASGCANLALRYADGRGVPRDQVRARDLFAKACGLGLAQACAPGGTVAPQASSSGERL